MGDNFNINLLQVLTGQFVVRIYKNSAIIGQIEVGTDLDEAKRKAGDLADAFKEAEITDQTD